MARKLYVGGLSFSTAEDQIREEFAKFGVVESVTVIRDRDSDRIWVLIQLIWRHV